MTREQKIKEITDAVDKALGGDVYELKEGCRLCHNNKAHFVVSHVTHKDIVKFKHEKLGVHKEIILGIDCETNWAVIGRPVTLEDVLRILREQIHISAKNGRILVISASNDRIVGVWILGKPLHEQSDETITFIYEEV